MSYLLDTCVISDFVKGNNQVMAQLKSTPPDSIAISSVTVMEIEYGLRINPGRAKKIKPIIDQLLSNITIISYDNSDAIASAQIRSQLKKQGTPIGPYDLMIGGCALNRNLTMVTSNTKEFNRITGLTLTDWKLD